MRIVTLGDVSAAEAINLANDRSSASANASQKMLDFFNSQGGDTAIKNTTTKKSDDPSVFDKIWGVFKKLDTIASTSPEPGKVVKPYTGPHPMLFLALGIGAFALLKGK